MKIYVFWFCVVLALFFSGNGSFAREGLNFKDTDLSPPEITVMADPSMTIPLSKIARIYAQEKNIAVATSFGAGSVQIKDLEDGQEGNVFITARPALIRLLQSKGLMDVYSLTNIATNRLVLLGPKNNITNPRAKKRLMKLLPTQEKDFQLALGDPEFLSEGTYALQLIRKLRLSRELEPSYSFFRDNFALRKAITQYGAYGFMFETDVLLYPDLNKLMTISSDDSSAIIYQAAVVAGDNMNVARDFLKFLTSKTAADIFKENGFNQ